MNFEDFGEPIFEYIQHKTSCYETKTEMVKGLDGEIGIKLSSISRMGRNYQTTVLPPEIAKEFLKCLGKK